MDSKSRKLDHADIRVVNTGATDTKRKSSPFSDIWSTEHDATSDDWVGFGSDGFMFKDTFDKSNTAQPPDDGSCSLPDVGEITDDEDQYVGIPWKNSEVSHDPSVLPRMRKLLGWDLPKKTVRILERDELDSALFQTKENRDDRSTQSEMVSRTGRTRRGGRRHSITSNATAPEAETTLAKSRKSRRTKEKKDKRSKEKDVKKDKNAKKKKKKKAKEEDGDDAEEEGSEQLFGYFCLDGEEEYTPRQENRIRVVKKKAKSKTKSSSQKSFGKLEETSPEQLSEPLLQSLLADCG